MNEHVDAAADEDVDAGGKLEVLDPTGHFEVHWGKKKSEVEAAEATFKDLLSKGYAAFKKTWTGKKGKQASAFEAGQGVYVFDKSVPPDSTPVTLPTVAKKEDEKEFTHEHTKEFDKKAETTLVPPVRGG
jgi:hypothetical protein